MRYMYEPQRAELLWRQGAIAKLARRSRIALVATTQFCGFSAAAAAWNYFQDKPEEIKLLAWKVMPWILGATVFTIIVMSLWRKRLIHRARIAEKVHSFNHGARNETLKLLKKCPDLDEDAFIAFSKELARKVRNLFESLTENKDIGCWISLATIIKNGTGGKNAYIVVGTSGLNDNLFADECPEMTFEEDIANPYSGEGMSYVHYLKDVDKAEGYYNPAVDKRWLPNGIGSLMGGPINTLTPEGIEQNLVRKTIGFLNVCSPKRGIRSPFDPIYFEYIRAVSDVLGFVYRIVEANRRGQGAEDEGGTSVWFG